MGERGRYAGAKMSGAEVVRGARHVYVVSGLYVSPAAS